MAADTPREWSPGDLCWLQIELGSTCELIAVVVEEVRPNRILVACQFRSGQDVARYAAVPGQLWSRSELGTETTA